MLLFAYSLGSSSTSVTVSLAIRVKLPDLLSVLTSPLSTLNEYFIIDLTSPSSFFLNFSFKTTIKFNGEKEGVYHGTELHGDASLNNCTTKVGIIHDTAKKVRRNFENRRK